MVGAIPDDRWASPTPCAAWRLDQLVAHMTAQHRGLAAGSSDPWTWAMRPVGPAPRDDYAAAAEAVLDAFAEDGAADRPFALPEIRTDRTFPGAQAIGFHLVDYVVHGWDVAAALGVPWSCDDETLGAALEIAERDIPVGPARERPGASFAPPASLGPNPSALARILALTGRSPSWAAPS